MKRSKVAMGLVASVVLSMVGSVLATPMTIPVTQNSSYRAGSGWPAGWYDNYAGTVRVSFADSAYFYAALPSISLSPGESIQINSATLNYYVYNAWEASSPVSATDQAFRISADWTPGPCVNDNPAGWDTTTQPPATSEGYGSYTLLGVPVSDLAGWKSVDITALAQAWVNGTYANQGVAVKQTAGDWVLQGINSWESSNVPYFQVDYSVVPEPATMGLLCLGGLGLLRRRK